MSNDVSNNRNVTKIANTNDILILQQYVKSVSNMDRLMMLSRGNWLSSRQPAGKTRTFVHNNGDGY